MRERMATYRGEIIPLSEPQRVLLAESACACGRKLECKCDRKNPRMLRRFVTRGGELVEVESVIRETR